MKSNRGSKVFVVLFLSTILSACGGGGSSNASNDANISASADLSTDSSNTLADASEVVSSGVITRFGSVYVNGVRYDTSNAQIVSADDGSVIIENPSNIQLRQYLGLGQVVTVRGSSNSDGSNGVASSVVFDNELIGPVSSVSVADSSFVVIGQTAAVTPDTIFDDSIIESVLANVDLNEDIRFADIESVVGQVLTLEQLLPVGTIVEVSGFPTQNGLEVTRVEDVNNRERSNGRNGQGFSGEVEVKGFVRNLSDSQFDINGLTVTFGVEDLDSEDFPDGILIEGQFVEVKGTDLVSTNLDATQIELEHHPLGRDDNDDEDGDDDSVNGRRIEIEGVITQLQPDAEGSGGVIVINGLEYRVSDLSQLGVGLRVEIKGVWDEDTLIIARVHYEAENTVRIEDRAISNDGHSIITRLGLVITPGARTRLDDKVSDDDELSLSEFVANSDGNYIKARGFPQSNDVIWTRVRIDDDDDIDCRLRGPVDNIDGDEADFSFAIQGITVDVGQIDSFSDFKDSSEIGIGRSAFFNLLEVGVVVQAKSIRNENGCINGVLTAREVEFEDESTNSFADGNPEDDDDSGDDGDNDDGDEIKGTVSSVDGNTFVVDGVSITVTDETIIDDSIIEALAC